MLAMASPIPVAPTTHDSPATATGMVGSEHEAEPGDSRRNQRSASTNQFLSRCTRRPGRPWYHEPPAHPKCTTGQGQPSHRRRQPTLLHEHQRKERLRTEERTSEDTPHGDDGRQAAAEDQGSRRQKSGHTGHQHHHRDDGGPQGRQVGPNTGDLQQAHPDRRRESEPHAPVPHRRTCGGRSVSARSPKARDENRYDGQGCDPQEDQPPAQLVGEEPGDQRPDDRRHHPRSGQGSEYARPEVVVVRATDQYVDGDDDDPAAQPLNRTAQHEGPIACAVPASRSPAVNDAVPATSGSRGPRRSQISPASTSPNRLVVKYAEKASA